MKNLYRKFSIFFSIMVLVSMSFPINVQAFRAPAVGLTSGISLTVSKPVFSSSFIQYWYSQDWNQARWEKELTMLKDIGITEVILQNIADTKDKYTVYPTTMSEYTSNDVDMVGIVLSAADKLDMKVRIGLGFNDDWWDKNASDIKAKNTYDVMISPFYNGTYSKYSPLSDWSTIVENVLKGTGINVLALQDSVGAGYNTTSQLENLFSYTKKAADALRIKLYGNIETYTSTLSGNISAPQSRISEQMVKENPYVQGFIAFSINHYQNKNETVQLDYYNDYYNYYLASK